MKSVRGANQRERLLTALRERDGWTLWELSERTGIRECCVSAVLRHLRKVEFGCYVIIKRLREVRAGTGNRTWEYSLAGK